MHDVGDQMAALARLLSFEYDFDVNGMLDLQLGLEACTGEITGSAEKAVRCLAPTYRSKDLDDRCGKRDGMCTMPVLIMIWTFQRNRGELCRKKVTRGHNLTRETSHRALRSTPAVPI